MSTPKLKNATENNFIGQMSKKVEDYIRGYVDLQGEMCKDSMKLFANFAGIPVEQVQQMVKSVNNTKQAEKMIAKDISIHGQVTQELKQVLATHFGIKEYQVNKIASQVRYGDKVGIHVCGCRGNKEQGEEK